MILAVQSSTATLALVTTLLQLKATLFLTDKDFFLAVLKVACPLLWLRWVFQVKRYTNLDVWFWRFLHRSWCFCLRFRADLERIGALFEWRRRIDNLVRYLHLPFFKHRIGNCIDCLRLDQQIGLRHIQRPIITSSLIWESHPCLRDGWFSAPFLIFKLRHLLSIEKRLSRLSSTGRLNNISPNESLRGRYSMFLLSLKLVFFFWRLECCNLIFGLQNLLVLEQLKVRLVHRWFKASVSGAIHFLHKRDPSCLQSNQSAFLLAHLRTR